MKFSEAMKHLEDGKKVRPKNADNKGLYFYKGTDEIESSFSHNHAGTACITWFDSEWELYEEPKPKRTVILVLMYNTSGVAVWINRDCCHYPVYNDYKSTGRLMKIEVDDYECD